MNMLSTIVPRSDQINADDLLGQTLTITITEVTIKPGEQPVNIFYEGGKPYRPCKSMCKVMVAAWGPDANAYVGRSMTLYRDPKVKWGGLEVGGIRISHMSHLERGLTLALTETKGSKKPHVVKPLQAEKPAQQQPAPQPAQAQPAVDQARKWVDAFLANVASCAGQDELYTLQAKPDVMKARGKLHQTRPELEQECQAAWIARMEVVSNVSAAGDVPPPADDANFPGDRP